MERSVRNFFPLTEYYVLEDKQCSGPSANQLRTNTPRTQHQPGSP